MMWTSKGFCIFVISLWINGNLGVPIADLMDDVQENPRYTLIDMGRAMKRSLVMGRNYFRPGKRSMESGNMDDLSEMLDDEMAKRSMVFGRSAFRPGKRSLEFSSPYTLQLIREDQMGKRSLTLGRGHYRPGKRSMAISRAGFRPGKRSLNLDLQYPEAKRSSPLVRSTILPPGVVSKTYENLGRMVNDMANRHQYLVVNRVPTVGPIPQPLEDA